MNFNFIEKFKQPKKEEGKAEIPSEIMGQARNELAELEKVPVPDTDGKEKNERLVKLKKAVLLTMAGFTIFAAAMGGLPREASAGDDGFGDKLKKETMERARESLSKETGDMVGKGIRGLFNIGERWINDGETFADEAERLKEEAKVQKRADRRAEQERQRLARAKQKANQMAAREQLIAARKAARDQDRAVKKAERRREKAAGKEQQKVSEKEELDWEAKKTAYNMRLEEVLASNNSSAWKKQKIGELRRMFLD